MICFKTCECFANYLGNAKNTQHHYCAGYLFDGYSFYMRNQFFAGYAYSLDFSDKSFLTFGSRAIFSIDNINAKN